MRSGASAGKRLSSIAKPDYCWEMRAPSLCCKLPFKSRWGSMRPVGSTPTNGLLLPSLQTSPQRRWILSHTFSTRPVPPGPLGVMISHANITHHLGAMQKALGYDPDSVSVCWMPHFHDYGLVEGVFAPVFQRYSQLFNVAVHVLENGLPSGSRPSDDIVEPTPKPSTMPIAIVRAAFRRGARDSTSQRSVCR